MLPDFTREMAYDGILAGVDEAGRGPWAGPVVAAAVVLNPAALPNGINDSKKVAKHKHEDLYDSVMQTALAKGVGIASVEEIDALNILAATKLAMRRAYDALAITPGKALVDGNQLPDLPCAMEALVDGDALCLSIAAASIVAKVTRDRIMRELACEFPQYGWQCNAGYGTKQHQEALRQYGVTMHHRRSFAPIRKLLQEVAA